MFKLLKRTLGFSPRFMNSSGYTIIEVMIFLTVSVGLFATAVVAISEQNRRVAFTQSVQDVERHLQDVFNDVENGFYPAIDQSQQGTDESRIFIGKAIQFGRNGERDQLAVSTIVGNRLNSQNNDVEDLSQAQPRLLEDTTGTKSTIPIDSEVEVTEYRSSGGIFSGINFAGIAVISGFSETSNNVVESGIVRPSLIPVGLGSAGMNDAAFSTQVENMGNYIGNIIETSIAPQGGTLCLQENGEGDDGRRAAIEIGVDSQRLSTNVIIDPDEGPCVS